MAIQILERQTLGFNPETNCICGTDYCQPFLTTDEFSLYGTTTRLNFNNLMTSNPFDTDQIGPSTNNFWDLDTDWSIGTDKMIAADVAAGSAATWQIPLGLQVGHMYLITVSVLVTGSEALENGVLITVNGDNLIYPDLVNGTGNFLPDGSGANFTFNYTWVYIPTSITTDTVVISRVNDTGVFEFEVLQLRILEMSMPALALYDLDGNQQFIETAFAGAITRTIYLDDFNGDLSNPEFTNASFLDPPDFISNNRYFTNTNVDLMNILFSMDIPVIELGYTGCGYIRIFDQAMLTNYIINGEFDGSLAPWDAGAGWTWVGGKANFNAGGVPPFDNGFLEQDITLLYGQVYTLSFELSGISNPSRLDVRLVVEGDTIAVADNLSAGGTMTFNIDLTDYTGSGTVTLRFQKDFPAANFTIDNVSLVLAAPDTLQESNCINIRETQNCTLLFTGTNTDSAFTDVDVFGYDFTDANVVKMIRLYAKKKYAGYPEQKDIFKFSNNLRRIMYAESDKEYEVNVGDAAEHAHDLLAILRLHDTFTIDGTQYTPNGDYELRPRKTSDNSQAIFLVVKTQGISSNYSCS